MKKKRIFFVMLSLFLFLCACTQGTGSGEQNPAPAQQPSTEIAEPEQESRLQAGDFEGIVKGGTYLLHYKGTVSFEGQSFETDVTFATNGEDTSIRNVMGDVTGHILVKDGITYQIDDTGKTYTPTYEGDGTEDVLAAAELKPSGTGTAEVYGKQLPYKEYTDGDGTIRYYFKDDKLYAVATKSPESESLLQVLELTDQVPAKMLELPVGYVEAALEYPESEASE